MWWLSFIGGSVVILEATSLSHARLLAAAKNLGRAAQFVEGYFIRDDLARMIPDDFLERLLSSDEGWRLGKRLRYRSQDDDARSGHPEAIVPSRLQA
jgi:hypothetical protein